MERKVTKPPKDQIERYRNDGVTHFKRDTPNSEIPRYFNKGKLGSPTKGGASGTPMEATPTSATSRGTSGSGQDEVRGDVHENFKDWSRGKGTERA